MMMRLSGPQPRRDAPALRFLLLCIGGWILLRIMIAWSPAAPTAPGIVRPPWHDPSPFAAAAPRGAPVAAPAPSWALSSVAPANPTAPTGNRDDGVRPPTDAGGFGAERRSLRLALMQRLLPKPGAAAWRALGAGATQAGPAHGAGVQPGRGKPFWIQRPRAGWSLGGWLYLREASAAAPDAIAAAGQLGGSQAAVRLAYGFGTTGRARAYGRATMAMRQPSQRELAFGVAFAPVAGWPVDVAIEQRVALGSQGRTALAAMVVAGVSDVALPYGFRLDAYGQAGVVGLRRRDGFADGAVAIDREIGRVSAASLHLGALAAGAVQPGAARIDVGPRLTLRLPEVGEGSRVALDWRQRVAGNARPTSGLALTLAADF